MTRIAGTPTEKLTFLSTLDPNILPHLVADILYFLYEHKEVRVVDGPGDGKRDVHSVQPNGARHISQCKYHQNTNVAVSSDETDELILALTKFGCKAGLFVTTGKISPQAKREYLDNYPGFQLNFIDGLGLVDAVLASPILSAVWLDGKSVTQIRSSLYVPFVLRMARDDRQIEFKKFTDTDDQDVGYKFSSGTCHKLDFDPYRPASRKRHEGYRPDEVRCYEVRCSGTIRIYDIPEHLRLIANTVAKQVDEESLPLIIRFGIPSLTANIDTSPDDRVKITRVRPQSFIITKSRTIMTERDWVVISKHEDWIFPKNLSVAEAAWAGWLSRSKNTILMQELRWPPFGPASFFTQRQHQLRQQWLEDSLFVGGSKSDCNILEKTLSEDDCPNWSCSYGPNGVLLGWLHPALEASESGHITFRYYGKEDKFEGIPRIDLQLNIFQERIKRIRDICAKNSLAEIPFQQARLIGAAAGEDLLPTPVDEGEFHSAELFHYYEDVPSPVYLQDRRFLFVRMWYVPVTPPEVRNALETNPINLAGDTSIYWDAKLGRRTKKTFLLSTLMFFVPPGISANEYFESIIEERDTSLKKLAEYIYSLWCDAELSTEFFWRTEVGFQIDDKGFSGNPWVIFEKDDDLQIVHITEDSKPTV